MEFPKVGKQCAEPTCNQLDFLPVKCDSCSKVFCCSHMLYDQHNCEAAYKKNVQVPVCPLCNTPIPINRGEVPDIKVGEHIDQYCQSDPAKKRRIYVNRCSVKGCKTKEMIKVTCSACSLNFCLKHRHQQDHSCQKPYKSQARSNPSNLLSKFSTPSNSNGPISNGPTSTLAVVQGSMSEDEALARALQLSMNDTLGSTSQPTSVHRNSDLDEDEHLAQAIAESEREYQRQQELQAKKDKCMVV